MAFGFIRNILGGTDRHHNAIVAGEDGVFRLELTLLSSPVISPIRIRKAPGV